MCCLQVLTAFFSISPQDLSPPHFVMLDHAGYHSLTYTLFGIYFLYYHPRESTCYALYAEVFSKTMWPLW